MLKSNYFYKDYKYIVVNRVIENLKVVGYTVFDLTLGKFEEVRYLEDCYYYDLDKLPLLNGLDFSLQSNGLILLGYRLIDDEKLYLTCYGDRLIQQFNLNSLQSKIILNAYVTSDSVSFCNSLMQDLSFLFENDTVDYVGSFTSSSSGSSGQNIKFVGIDRKTKSYGLVKFPLTSSSMDCKNEIVCKSLADLFRVPCCSALSSTYCNRDCVLSVYDYDRSTGISPTSLRQVLNSHGRTNLDFDLLYSLFGDDFKEDYLRFMIFDVITNQEDRHLSNLSILNGKLYPLYDNGRSLFNGRDYLIRDEKYALVKRLGPTVVKTLINTEVKYAEIFKAINDVYGGEYLETSTKIAYSIFNTLLDIVGENYER